RLRNLLLYDLGGSLDEVLCFLQTETGDLANGLDDLNLVGTCGSEHDVELGLLGRLLGLGAARGSRRDGDGRGSGLHAPLVLELFDELGDLNDWQIRKIIDDLLPRDLSHDETPSTWRAQGRAL